MKVLVGVKRVIDYNVRIRVRPDGSGVETANVKMSMNPFDEIALEEAVRMKEAGIADEVVVLSIGPQQSQETLRAALAMGADRAILLKTDTAPDPLAAAKFFKKIAEEENPEIILLGKQAIDDDCGQTGQMLAALLDWGQATFASRIELADGNARVTREIDGGLQTIAVRLPTVITVDLRLNEPRYASLPNIMKAKKKPLEERDAGLLGIDIAPRLEVLKTGEPGPRKMGTRVASVAELVDKLKTEAGVL